MSGDPSATVSIELEPADAALLARALEQLIEKEPGTPVADRALVLAAYLRLQRHKAMRDENGVGERDDGVDAPP